MEHIFDTTDIPKGRSPFIVIGIGSFIGLILCCAFVYTTRLVVRQPLLNENKQLLAQVIQLQKENQQLRASQIKPGIPTEQPVLHHEEKIVTQKAGDELALRAPVSNVPNVRERSLLVYVGEYSLSKLDGIKHMLYVLKARKAQATFVFTATARKLRIMRQIQKYGHEIGFEDQAPDWAPQSAPIVTSVHEKSAATTHPYVDYHVRVDAPGNTTQELTSSFLRTNPGQIILVDPERNTNASRALSRALRNIQHIVTVGELLHSTAIATRRESNGESSGRLSMAKSPDRL